MINFAITEHVFIAEFFPRPFNFGMSFQGMGKLVNGVSVVSDLSALIRFGWNWQNAGERGEETNT